MCTQKNAFTKEKRKAGYVKVAALWKVSVICHWETVSVPPRFPPTCPSGGIYQPPTREVFGLVNP